MAGTRVFALFRERRLLVVLSVGLPLTELGLLALLGLRSGRGLAAQVTAPGPFGVFHDLRWLFVFHRSVLAFVLGFVALVALRSVLGALLVRSAWPGTPPPLVMLLRYALVSTLVASVFLSPWVTLLFGAAVVPLSWVYFAALGPALATILVLCHGGVDRGWWRRLPPARAASWTAGSFLALSLSAFGVADQPPAVAAAVVAGTGVFNAWAWEHAVGAVVRGLPGRSRRLVPVTLGMAVFVFVGVLVSSQVGFATLAERDPGTWVAGEARPGVKAVLLVGGFASGCCDEGPALQGGAEGVYVEQFSYLGVTLEGDPLPHTGDATDVDVSRAAGLMAHQVEGLAQRSGGPVSVVAESEGTLVVAAYLAAHPEPPVDRLMLLSPILEPARVRYPDPGVDGPGVVAGQALRLVGAMVDAMTPYPVSADGPLTSSLLREAEALRGAATCDRPRIEEVVILPLADAVTAPPGAHFGVETIVVPAFHGGLRGRPEVQQMIRGWLAGQDLQGSGFWMALDRVIAGIASAWQVPDLDPAAAGDGCPEVG